MDKKIEEIKNVIEKIRPYIQRDGGDLEFVDFEDGIVKVRFLGACVDCMAIGDTLKDGVTKGLPSFSARMSYPLTSA